MDLELWAEISAAIGDVGQRTPANRRDTYSTACVVRIHLWAVLHDRPTEWACDERNWTARTCPAALPHRSRMGRRMARADFEAFLVRVGRRLNGRAPGRLFKVVDGHALELANHTTDPDAGWGRGRSRTAVGYKLHVIDSGKPMPDAFAVTPLDVCEKRMAARMIGRVKGGGYLLGDAHYDASWLSDHCRTHGHQLVCPRAKPHTGLGHRYQSRSRLRGIDLLEPPGGVNDFGRRLYKSRPDIERAFSGLSCFGGGLTTLPPWVRRAWRVRRWVWAKLLINAARLRRLAKTAA